MSFVLIGKAVLLLNIYLPFIFPDHELKMSVNKLHFSYILNFYISSYFYVYMPKHLQYFVHRIPDSMSKEIEKSCQSIYPIHEVYIRKVKCLKKPKFDCKYLCYVHFIYIFS